MVFGLAVLTVIVLIRVIDDDPASLGVNTAGSTSQDDGGTVTTTTLPPGGSTTTTRPGTTATTALDPAGRAVIQEGSQGADVQLLQQRLIALGLLTGAADGVFGPGTKAAVIQFQTTEGITPADGVVGETTWKALSTG